MNRNSFHTIVNVYDFGRNVGGINPIVSRCSELLAERYTVYQCYAEESEGLTPDGVIPVSLSDACGVRNSEYRRAVQSTWNLKADMNFEALLENLDPNKTVVHFHGWGMGLSASVVRRAKLKGFRLFYTAHDYSLVCPNGVYFNFSEMKDCDFKPMSFRCLISNCDKKGRVVKAQRVIRKSVEKISGVHWEDFEKIICVSETVYEVMCNLGVSNLIVISNPYESASESSQDDATYDFVFVGRLVEEKGISLLLEAVSIMGGSCLVIGGGDLLDKLKEKHKDVDFTGWVNPKDIPGLMNKAKVFVLPSLWRETSGLVVDDALINGIFAVVPSGTGAELKVKNGGGLVFKRGDKDSLVETLRKALTIAENKEPFTYQCTTYSKYVSDLEKIYAD